MLARSMVLRSDDAQRASSMHADEERELLAPAVADTDSAPLTRTRRRWRHGAVAAVAAFAIAGTAGVAMARRGSATVSADAAGAVAELARQDRVEGGDVLAQTVTDGAQKGGHSGHSKSDDSEASEEEEQTAANVAEALPEQGEESDDAPAGKQNASKPHIFVSLIDDQGFGDMGCVRERDDRRRSADIDSVSASPNAMPRPVDVDGLADSRRGNKLDRLAACGGMSRAEVVGHARR